MTARSPSARTRRLRAIREAMQRLESALAPEVAPPLAYRLLALKAARTLARLARQ